MVDLDTVTVYETGRIAFTHFKSGGIFLFTLRCSMVCKFTQRTCIHPPKLQKHNYSFFATHANSLVVYCCIRTFVKLNIKWLHHHYACIVWWHVISHRTDISTMGVQWIVTIVTAWGLYDDMYNWTQKWLHHHYACNAAQNTIPVNTRPFLHETLHIFSITVWHWMLFFCLFVAFFFQKHKTFLNISIYRFSLFQMHKSCWTFFYKAPKWVKLQVQELKFSLCE